MNRHKPINLFRNTTLKSLSHLSNKKRKMFIHFLTMKQLHENFRKNGIKNFSKFSFWCD